MAAEDLDPRLTALEGRISEVIDRLHRAEQDSAAARDLASGVVRDVAVIRAEVRDFHKVTAPSIDTIHRDLAALRTQMHHGFVQMCGEIDTVLAGTDQVLSLLNTLIDQQPRPGGTARCP
ncbi:hypothetical protein ACIG56_26720 [Nocardia fusca]|uniref:hypothetical protein n=1 Tax=Nocardia fusca TaxID=941183 RepID=UPI0037C69EDB